jgi:hypothetical protein
MEDRVYILRLFNHDGSPLPPKVLADEQSSIAAGFQKIIQEAAHTDPCELQKGLVGVFIDALRRADHQVRPVDTGPCELVNELISKRVAVAGPVTEETHEGRPMSISLDGTFLGSFGYKPCERVARTNATRFAVVSCDKRDGRYTGHIYVYLPDVTYSEAPGTSLGDHVPCKSVEVFGVVDTIGKSHAGPRMRYYHENPTTTELATAPVRSEWVPIEPDDSALMIGTGTLTLPLLVGAVQVARVYQKGSLGVPSQLGTSIIRIDTGYDFDTWYASISCNPIELEVLDCIPPKLNDGA